MRLIIRLCSSIIKRRRKIVACICYQNQCSTHYKLGRRQIINECTFDIVSSNTDSG